MIDETRAEGAAFTASGGEEGALSVLPGRSHSLCLLLSAHRDEIVARTRFWAGARVPLPCGEREFEAGVELLVAQLALALRFPESRPDLMAAYAAHHGRDLLSLGFAASDVVHCYGNVCQALMELALRHEIHVEAHDFRQIYSGLVAAMTIAVEAHQRAGAERASGTQVAGLVALVREFSDRVDSALVGLGELKLQRSDTRGGGELLDMSLRRLERLIGQSFLQVRGSVPAASANGRGKRAKGDASP